MTFKFNTLNLTREDAYQMAFKIVMEDPRYRLCEIALCAGNTYSVRCWEANEKYEMTFESVNGEHVLFFSDIIFRWKDKVPIKAETDTFILCSQLVF